MSHRFHTAISIVIGTLLALLAFGTNSALAQPSKGAAAQKAQVKVTVRGDGGQPVANARVSASGPGGTQQATSDAQGVATLTLPSGTFSLQATAATFAKPATGTVSVPQQQAVTIVFPASPVPFVVTVVDGESKPVAGASVQITTAANVALSGTTGSDGRAQFSVSRGAAKSVDVTKAGYLAGNASGVQIGAQGGAVQVVLKAAEIAYTLTVHDESGKPVPGARALVTSVKGTVVFQGTADASGVITLRQPSGGYRAAVSAAGFQPQQFGPFGISETGPKGSTLTIRHMEVKQPPLSPLVSGLGAKLTIKVGDGASPSISGGVPPYNYVSENPGIVTISLHRAGDFQINGVAPGTTRVVLRDSRGQQFISTVVVEPSQDLNIGGRSNEREQPPLPLRGLSANETLKVGIGTGFQITGGVPPYSCDSENPGIVKAFRVGNDVQARDFQINGVAPGTTRIIMRDSRGQQIISTVVVQK